MSKEYIREVLYSDTNALKRFVAFVHEVTASYPLFYSEMDSDVMRQLSGKSSFFRDMQYALFVASNGTQDVARCTALINPRYQNAKNEPVGFIGYFAAAPDCAPPLFRSLKGKLGPTQIIKLLLAAGRYRRAGLIMVGVLPDQRRKGVAQTLAATLYRRYEEKGLEKAFYHLVNENNIASRRFAESMGGQGHLMYHVYDKHLD